jgi:hypothetical protein
MKRHMNRKSTIAQSRRFQGFIRSNVKNDFAEPEVLEPSKVKAKKGWLPVEHRTMLAERELVKRERPFEIRNGNVIRRPAIKTLFTHA